jgi:Right handed beta helix region/PA14 domain
VLNGTRPLLALLLFAPILRAQDPLPEVVVDKDDFAVTKSCRLVIAKDVIPDANGDGVIHVKAPGIVVEMRPEDALWGTRPPAPPDTFAGVGIRIDGQKNVTLRGFRVRGFKVGIHATRADGLKIESADLADLWRHRLRSTPAAEDGADWLWPHDNDDHQWRKNYGAAICVEDSREVRLLGCKVRKGQNGILFDRVNEGQVWRCDCSFLSGWGLALWRSNHNFISANAFDFCIRGYSHGVYNRGQDSAGILMFEQCSENQISDNSVTHGGDGVFAFAGKEALGDTPPPSSGFDYKERGCNRNSFFRNDLSYAAAHGLELTFSFGNAIRENRFVGNAICGIWGGYSQHTFIELNEFTDNGEMGYGLERGGVNIEHGFLNTIQKNKFTRNRCGVHLWWTDNKDFPKKPWGLANYKGCKWNVLDRNSFVDDKVAIHLRSSQETTLRENEFRNVGRELDSNEAKTTEPLGQIPHSPLMGDLPRLPDSRPVGARAHLRGRENIIMTEWGPWDHETPFIRPLFTTGSEHIYEIRAFTNPKLDGDPPPPTVDARIDSDVRPPRLHVKAKKPGVTPYSLQVRNDTAYPVFFPVKGTILAVKWNVRFFKTSAKPHENADAWKADSAKADASFELDSLDLKFGFGGPDEAAGVMDLRGPIGRDHFGLVAETQLPLPAGKWKITTLSDDGIRVTANGKKIIDRWNWHGPEKDTAILDLPQPKTVPIRVEYFELDGYAVLTLAIEPASP